MDESTKPKRNRAEKKNKAQQIKESQIKDADDGDNDSVFEHPQGQKVYLLLCYIYRLIFRMNALYNLFTYALILLNLIHMIYIIIIISEIT